MKPSRPIFWFLAAVVLLIVAAVFLNRQPVGRENAQTSTETNGPASPVARNAVQPGKNNSVTRLTSNAEAASIQPKPQLAPQARDDKAATLTAVLNANDADISFYGRLEDQFSNAVANAEVNFSVQYENAKDRGNKGGQVISDSNGFFTISGYRGASLGLAPKKTGYALSTDGTSFRYSQISPGYFVPDANNPIIIKMWKLQGVEPLVGVKGRYKIPFTSAPMAFDILTGQSPSSGGDLKITVHRPDGEISGRNPQGWSITVDVLAGGLIETSQGEARVTYAAPESGYQASGTFEKNNGPDLVDKMLFIESRNGRVYSKLHLSFEINRTPGGIMDVEFNGVANANGSRNWEATAPQ